MPRYVNLSQDILEDPDFVALSPPAALGWFRLRLDPRIGISGMGRIAPDNLSVTLRLGRGEAFAVVDELQAWLRYDVTTGLLWWLGAYEREPNNLSARSAALRELERVPRGGDARLWVGEWLDRYGPRWRASGVTMFERQRFEEFCRRYSDRSALHVVRSE